MPTDVLNSLLSHNHPIFKYLINITRMPEYNLSEFNHKRPGNCFTVLYPCLPDLILDCRMKGSDP